VWVDCCECGNGIMHMAIRWPEDPIEARKLKLEFKEMNKNVICKCCRYPKEVNCLTGCKMYDQCDNPHKKPKPPKIRYIPYPL